MLQLPWGLALHGSRNITLTLGSARVQGGMEVVRDVRQNWPDTSVRIIAVTADAFEDTRENCLRSGFDGWLAKPFRIEDLAAVMDAIPARQ